MSEPPQSGFVRRAVVTAVLAIVTAAGCAGGQVAAPAVSSPAGSDERPRELAGPATRLVLTDPASGATVVLDVATGTETPIGEFGPAAGLSSDGRFGYLRTRDGVRVVDSGAWTFDHGDHDHHYAIEPAFAGTVAVPAESVTADGRVVVVRSAAGQIELVDRDRLARREIGPPPGLKTDNVTGAAAAVPFQTGVLMVTRSGELRLLSGQSTRTIPGECPGVAGVAVVGEAVVFGCRTGAVQIAGRGAAPVVTAIPIPAPAPNHPGPLVHRDGVLAAVAGDDVWLLDSRHRAWSSVRVPNAVTAIPGDRGEVLVLTRDGVLRAFDTAAGAQTGSVPLFTGGIPAAGPAPVIAVDSAHAYVNDGAAHAIHQVDYGDALQLNRSVPTGVAPGLMAAPGG